MTYQPMHYNISVKPIFVKDNGAEDFFEGLTEYEETHRGLNLKLYNFIEL